MKIKQINKQTKENRKLWVWCLLHSYAHCLTLRHICVLYCKHTNKCFISGRVRRKSLFFSIFWTRPPFFSWVIGNTPYWRALSRSHKLFSCPWTTFLDAFLKKHMAQPTWKSKGIAKCRVKICNWVVRN